VVLPKAPSSASDERRHFGTAVARTPRRARQALPRRRRRARLYDAAEEATLSDVQHYARSYLGEEASMHGWEINLISPTRFASFVAHRLVATWRQ
jgi:hypothetical protein